MDAKHVSQLIEGYERCTPPFLPPVVMEALREYASLLASVEGSSDEVVRELREWSRIYGDGQGSTPPSVMARAAAHIIALKARAEKAEAELASVKDRAEKAEERAQWWRNKTHEAETVACDALASFGLTQHVEDYPEDHWSHRAERFRAYRAAHPKDAP